jgi:DNA-binding SARP family transcriptional activator
MGIERRFFKNNMSSKTAAVFSPLATLALMLSLFFVGCSKPAIPKVPTDTKAFESADPKIKANWEKAISAAAANDYATAILTCRQLQTESELTPQQRTAVIDTITAENNQLLDGLKKGDQNAIHANEQILKGWGNPNEVHR